MKLDEALESLGEAPDDPPVDIEAGLKRLRGAVRRLNRDPSEARRIDDLAKLADRNEKDYRLGREALRKQDFDVAEHHLRRAAQHGSDEAAHWLGLLLEMQSIRQRLKGRSDKAGKLAAEAREWRLRAQESGIGEALDEATSSAAELEVPRQDRWQDGAREAASAPPAQQAPSGAENLYAIGVELLPFKFTAVLIDSGGKIINEKTCDLPDMEADTVVSVLAATATEIVVSAFGRGFPANQVVLGVQLGGPIDTKTGTVHFFSKHPAPSLRAASDFKWQNFPLGPRLQRETGFQTVIMNDAVAFAEWEQWFGVGQHTGDFAVMLIREGVGGAVVSDGEHFEAPVEIGNFRWGSESLEESDAGDQFGVLELDGGTTGVTRSASEHVGHTITDVDAAAEAADEEGPGRAATAAFVSAGVAIACGISYLVQFTGPTHVVLYGPEPMLNPERRAARVFLKQVQKFPEAVAFEVYRNCELVLRPIDLTVGAQGAGLSALNRCFHLRTATSPISTGSVK